MQKCTDIALMMRLPQDRRMDFRLTEIIAHV